MNNEAKLLLEIAELRQQIIEKDRMLGLLRMLINETKYAIQAATEDATLAQRNRRATDEKVGAGGGNARSKTVSDEG